MTLKYEITGIQHSHREGLYRICALRGYFKIQCQSRDLGGYIESEWNLSQEGDCWIGGDATVHGSGQVYNNAWVFENAKIYGNARVYENAKIYGNAWVTGHSQIFGNAKVGNYAEVCDHVRVYGNARLYGAWVGGAIKISESMEISGASYIDSECQIYYADGVTAFFDENKELIVNGTSSDTDIEYHKTLARLKLS